MRLWRVVDELIEKLLMSLWRVLDDMRGGVRGASYTPCLPACVTTHGSPNMCLPFGRLRCPCQTEKKAKNLQKNRSQLRLDTKDEKPITTCHSIFSSAARQQGGHCRSETSHHLPHTATQKMNAQ